MISQEDYELTEIDCPHCGENHFLVTLRCTPDQQSFLDGVKATHWAVCPLVAEIIWVQIPDQEPLEIDPSYILVSDCSACGGNHMVKMHDLPEPVELDGFVFTHYALCPLTDQKLLVQVDNGS